MWASLWFVFALVCSTVGLIFAIDGHTYKKGVKQLQQKQKQQQNGIEDISSSKDQFTNNAEIQC